MFEIYILKAFDFYRQEYYSCKFLSYDDAERTSKFLMQKPEVWAVKIHKMEWLKDGERYF